MMYLKQMRHEAAGQAIIFVAFMLAALIGMAGLAIDGGEVYLAQRRAQNAVDAALLNAGYTLCTNGPGADVLTAGYEAAAANDFTEDGIDKRITINNPPTIGQFAGDDSFVEAIVEVTAPTHLIQVIYKGATEISLYGVVQCANPGGHDIVPFPNASIVTLDETDAKAFNAVGNSDNYFCGGGVWSNGGGFAGGSTAISRFTYADAFGTGDTVPGHGWGSEIDLPYSDFPDEGCTDPSFYYAGAESGNLDLSAQGFSVTSDTGVTAEDPFANIDPPARPATCSPAITNGGEYTITGTECFYGLDPKNHTTVTISGAEGRDDNVLYIDGDISTPTHGSVIINNVLVYVTGTVDFKADTTVTGAYTDGPWHGFTMWIEGSGYALSTEAHAINHLTGTFYVPNGDAKINGRSGSVWRMQLIALTVRYNGCSGNIFIYDPDAFFSLPVQPTLSIIE